MLPRRRDKTGKSVDDRIAIGANSDGFPVGVRSDRRIRDGVSQRIERVELSGSRNKWPHVLRRPSQRSLLSKHSESSDSATEEEESHDRDTRKALHIEESDDDSPANCCRNRSLLNTVRKRSTKGLHEEQYSVNTPRSGRYSTHVRQLSPRQKTGEVTSHSPRHQDEHNQTVTAYSSDREPRTSRRSRTPMRTGKKAKKRDLSPRTKRGVSPRSKITPARRSRTDSTEKTVKRGKNGDSHRQCPFTADISPQRSDNSKSYFTYRHKKGSASSNYEDGTEEDTDSDTMIESPPKGRERSPSPIE